MALEEIRQNKSGKGVYVVIGLLLLGMIGFGTSEFGLNRETRQTEIFEAGKAKITEAEYRNRLSRVQASNPDMPLAQTQQLVLDSLRRQVALEDFINQYPVLPDAATIDNAIVNNPSFQLGGEFNQEAMNRVVQGQFRMQLSEYRQSLAKEMGLDIIQRTIINSSIVSDVEVAPFLLLNNVSRDVRIAKIAASTVSNTASTDEIAAYYEENKGDFLSDEQVAFTYVELNPADIESTITVTDEEIATANAPIRSANYYLFSDEASAQSAYDKLVAGEPIDAVKQAAGATLEDSGDLGAINPEVGADDIVPQAIADALYAINATGQFSAPVVTELGVYLVELTDMSDSQPLDAVRDELIATLRAAKAEPKIREINDKLNTAVFEAATPTVAAIAEATGLAQQTQSLTALTSNQGILATPELVQSIQDSNRNTNELQEPVVIGDRVIVYQLTDVIAPEQLALDEVRDQIEQQIIADKNKAELQSMAEALVESAKTDGLETAAKASDYPVKLIENFDAQMSEDDFVDVIAKFLIAQQPPLLGNEYAELVDSPTGDFYVYVNEEVRFDETADDQQRETLKANLAQQLGASQLSSFANAITERANIKDRSARVLNATDDTVNIPMQ
ncbi:SurA N-terminal domain-containing protein [Ostreibacterium oceani]|uniref:Periplasmic chaperone PpiD n=1 Tax=Ostreibacterium oceani TaxID=2654998 RepID=A0A6N7EVB7_9GAMM|nr:SurA N-terminal domain-containing protein [Ostreibacterium oceani]MPV86501.1 hypothetical protein [Ostreibacterium oceani]